MAMRVLEAIATGVVILGVQAAAAATAYTYDTLGRLSTASYDNGKQIVYNYDPAGNRSSVVTQNTPLHAPAKTPVHTGTGRMIRQKH
jgi:uncharacterized protein RhaS with RHS repeats